MPALTEEIPMCGRFTFQPTEAFYARFQISNRLDSLVPRYNIAPGQMVPVIIANSPRRIVLMRRGLIPHWAKDEKTADKMINARVETKMPGLIQSLRRRKTLWTCSPEAAVWNWTRIRCHGW
jgi:SOS response associated peptidase (SRAP)